MIKKTICIIIASLLLVGCVSEVDNSSCEGALTNYLKAYQTQDYEEAMKYSNTDVNQSVFDLNKQIKTFGYTDDVSSFIIANLLDFDINITSTSCTDENNCTVYVSIQAYNLYSVSTNTYAQRMDNVINATESDQYNKNLIAILEKGFTITPKETGYSFTINMTKVDNQWQLDGNAFADLYEANKNQLASKLN